MLKARYKNQKTRYAVIAVSEGAKFSDFKIKGAWSKAVDQFGHIQLGGVAETLAKEIERRTKLETRHVVLGHTQRRLLGSVFCCCDHSSIHFHSLFRLLFDSWTFLGSKCVFILLFFLAVPCSLLPFLLILSHSLLSHPGSSSLLHLHL